MALRIFNPCSIRAVKPSVFSVQASQQHRTFLNNLFPTSDSSNSGSTAPQTLTASRTLSYPALDIYDIIADVKSYPSFVPLCSRAEILSTSQPDKHYGKRWPQLAALTVGLPDRGIAESFISRVYCVPPSPLQPASSNQKQGQTGLGVVEAISGDAPPESSLPAADIAHHDHSSQPPQNTHAQHTGESPLSMLKTRWSVRGLPSTHQAPQTDVHLEIEFRFKSPVYEMLSRAVTATLADRMVAAFEERVRHVLGPSARNSR